MATHSRVPAWRIPGTGEPGGLTPMGSQSRTRLKRLSSGSHSWLLLTSNISWQSSFCLKKPFTDYVLWGKFLNLLYFSDVRSGWTGKSGFQDFSHTADYRVSPALPNWDKTDRNLNKQLPRDTLSTILSTSKCQQS